MSQSMRNTETYAIAHRGLSSRHRENTMAAFAAALDHAEVLELDVRCTHDRVLVCAHDKTLLRSHGVDLSVGHLTFDELRRHAPDIARLDDVLDAFGARCGWFLDCKVLRPRAIDELVRVVADTGLSWDSSDALRAGTPLEAGTACFEAPDPEVVQRFRARTGAGCVELVRGETTAIELTLTAPFATAYAQGVVIPHGLAGARMVRLLRTLKLGVYAYTVNDQRRFDELSAVGVQGIFTDCCDEIC